MWNWDLLYQEAAEDSYSLGEAGQEPRMTGAQVIELNHMVSERGEESWVQVTAHQYRFF